MEPCRQIRDGPPDIARNQSKHADRGGRKALDAKVAIQKDSGDVRTLEQILQIAIGLIQFGDFAVELGVDGFKLLVERLEFLLGGLQLFVRRLILFVCGF